MNPAPQVSVIIPTWNWSRALRCAITTVLRQTFEDFELLVVGDGCTDNSAEVVASFKDQRVQWHNLPENAGNQFAPNNAALEMAQGEYIAYLGHDDLWLPDHLKSLVSAADQSNADVAVAGVLMVGPVTSGLRGIAGLLSDELLRSDPVGVPPSGILHRADVARVIGGWRRPDECALPPDMDFLRRCWEYRRRVAATGRMSVIKFNACWRPGTYATLDASDQEEWLGRMQHEAGFLEIELQRTLACFASGKLISLGPLHSQAHAPKGLFASQMRHIRGLSGKPVGTEQVPGGIRFTAEHIGLVTGWYFPEVSPETGPFRWSGPETLSVCEFADVPGASRHLRIRLAGAISEDQFQIEAKINGAELLLTRENMRPGFVFCGTLPELRDGPARVRVELRVPRTVRPCDVNPNSMDERRLGVMFSWIEFLSTSGEVAQKVVHSD